MLLFPKRPALLATLLLTISSWSQAQSTLTWDGNGSTAPNPNGGTGTWDTNTTANWWNGATNVVWPGTSSGNDDAVFANTAGTVTISGTVTANNLTFNTSGYTLTGGSLLLDGTTPGVSISSGTAIINSTLSGAAGFTKSGGGTLTLGGLSNNYTGGTVLNGGTLAFGTNSDVHLGSTSGGLTFNGGQIAYSDGFVLNRNVTVNANMALTNAITVNGVLSGNASITQSGSDVATFSNTGNTFTGSITSSYAMSFASLGDSANAITLANNGWSWTGSAKTFALRPFTLTGTGTSPLNSNGSGALVIQQSLAFSSIGATKTLLLGGSYTGGANTFAGSITNGPSSVLSFTKAGDNSIWALSGTNTYTGATTLAAGGSTADFGLLIFRGIQSLPSSTSLNQAQTSFNQRWGTIRLLDDSATPASRSGVNLNWSIQENINPATDPNRYFMRVFVGNNSTANGGTSSSTQAGSTIQLGNLTLTEGSTTATGSGLWVTGANGYKLQIADVNVTLDATTAVNHQATLRANAPLTVTGTVRQANDAAVGSQTTLQLEGSALGSQISGNIQNSTGGRLMLVTKDGLGDWTLSGTNSYTGGTTITTGKLQFNGANSLPTTGTVAVGPNGHLSLADGTARNQTVSALTLTSLGSLSFDWTASGTGDQLTSTAAITPTAGSNIAINLNRGGTPGGSVALLTGGAGSSLNNANYYLANTTDFTATLTKTATTLSVGGYTSQTPLTAFYWAGNKLAAATVGGVDNAWALSNGTVSNWSSTTTGYTGTALTPGATADVIFSNSQVGKTQQSTVLGADVTVKSVTIDDSVAVTIAGANGAALTLMSTSGTAGTVSTPGSAISVTSNANATSTISSRVILGANQTWHVASGKTLAVSGIVGGNFGLTKASAGTLTLSALPEYTGTTTISAGALTFGGGLSGGASIIGRTSGITLSQGATLNFNTSITGINNVYTAGAPITLNGGAGTANIRVGGNDVRLYVSGNVTGQSGVAQTLSISQGLTPTGTTGGGDRQNILFSGVIANGGSGGTLGVSVNFAGSSGLAQNAFVNLSGQNTFTGDLTVTNSRGMNGGSGAAGAWLTIGGERFSTNPAIITNIGNGYLGGGNYAGNISISNGTGITTLSYMSTANQTLSGQISGTGNVRMDGTNTLTLTGNNSYTGTTTVSGGLLEIGGGGVLGGGNYAANISNVSTLRFNSTADQILGGVISGTGALQKQNTGTLILTNDNSYTGATSLTSGALAINGTGDINSTAGLTINGGTLRYNSSVNLSAPVTFIGGIIGGTNLNGSLGNLSIGAGQTLSPGNSPGIANTINQTWADGGTYTWELNNATGTAGSDPGWDLLFGTGTLSVTATSGTPFAIDVTSLSLGNLPGNAFGFLDTISKNWLIADFANPVSGFNANAFAIDTSAFTNPFTGAWAVALGSSGSIGGDNTQVYLTYTALTAIIPEPSRALLALFALGCLTIRRRR